LRQRIAIYFDPRCLFSLRQHAPRGFWPLANGGEPAVLFCFIFLFITVAGPGVWSLDAVWRSWRLHHRIGKPGEHDRWVPSH